MGTTAISDTGIDKREPAAYAEARRAERALWARYGLKVTERYVTAGEPGCRVRILECGNPQGRPVVFVQGGLGEAYSWVPLLKEMSDLRCVTLDRPGGGMSGDIDPQKVDLPVFASDVLAAVVKTSGLDRASFIANSMGGWWTFQLAFRRPEMVDRLVFLGCPAILLDTLAPLPMRLISLPVIGPILTKFMVATNPDKARAVPAFLGHPVEVGRAWPQEMAEAAYRFSQLPGTRRSWYRLLHLFLGLRRANPDLRITAEQLSAVHRPTLFGWGPDDPFGTPEDGRAAARFMPDARLEIVGRGHLPWWDEPANCARLAREFIEP